MSPEQCIAKKTIRTFWGVLPPCPFLISLSSKDIPAKDWSKTQSTLCSFVLPIPNELTFSTAFVCCTLRHFSLNKLFTGITLVSLYLHTGFWEPPLHYC